MLNLRRECCLAISGRQKARSMTSEDVDVTQRHLTDLEIVDLLKAQISTSELDSTSVRRRRTTQQSVDQRDAQRVVAEAHSSSDIV